MSKKELVDLYAEIKTSNWINSGDRTEDQREETKRIIKGYNAKLNKKELLKSIKNDTIYDKKLEASIVKMGLR